MMYEGEVSVACSCVRARLYVCVYKEDEGKPDRAGMRRAIQLAGGREQDS